MQKIVVWRRKSWLMVAGNNSNPGARVCGLQFVQRDTRPVPDLADVRPFPFRAL